MILISAFLLMLEAFFAVKLGYNPRSALQTDSQEFR